VRLGEPANTGSPPKTQIEQVESAIIFEDRDFLVIDKPSGVASHGGSGVSFGAIELLRAARPGDTLELAHRLDRDTSGILVLARRRPALTGLQELIRDNQTTKQYLALLKGHTQKAKFDVNASLQKSLLQGGERMVRVTDDGKPSLTRFRIADIFNEASLAEVTLFTGRTHQIRVHAQHIEHPLAGDEKYGEKGFNQNMRGFGLKRLFLHAARFEFDLDGRSRSFTAPLAPDLAAVLDALPRGVSRKGNPRR
jgi:23S rRNA pseudouridine955/2504/2580 synthase